jgi:hypothetical protein
LSLLPVDLWNIDVIASTPNKLVLHINNISDISGASTFVKVHHKHINKLTIQPVNPQILLLEIAFSPENNCIQNSLNFIIIKYLFANIPI